MRSAALLLCAATLLACDQSPTTGSCTWSDPPTNAEGCYEYYGTPDQLSTYPAGCVGNAAAPQAWSDSPCNKQGILGGCVQKRHGIIQIIWYYHFHLNFTAADEAKECQGGAWADYWFPISDAAKDYPSLKDIE